MKVLKNYLAGCLLFYSCVSVALETDLQQPLEISADKARFDQQAGIAIYEGNVIANQGSIRIQADYLKITSHTTSQSFDQVEARGDPALFHQQINTDGTMIHGQGDNLLYRVEKGVLEITGNGSLKRLSDEIQADYIRYTLAQGTFIAEKQGNNRVTIKLQPGTPSN